MGLEHVHKNTILHPAQRPGELQNSTCCLHWPEGPQPEVEGLGTAVAVSDCPRAVGWVSVTWTCLQGWKETPGFALLPVSPVSSPFPPHISPLPVMESLLPCIHLWKSRIRPADSISWSPWKLGMRCSRTEVLVA